MHMSYFHIYLIITHSSSALQIDLGEEGEIVSHFKDMIDVSYIKQENEKLLESNRDVNADLEEARLQ